MLRRSRIRDILDCPECPVKCARFRAIIVSGQWIHACVVNRVLQVLCIICVCVRVECKEGTWEEEETWEVSGDGGTTVGKKFIYVLLLIN